MKLEFSDITEAGKIIDFLFEDTIDGLCVLDRYGNVVAVNRTFCSIFSVKENEVEGKSFGQVIGCPVVYETKEPCSSREDCLICTMRNSFYQALEETGPVNILIERAFYIDGKRCVKYFNSKVKKTIYNGKPIVILSFNDVTKYEEQKKHIESLTNRDSLTNLYTRQFLLEYGPYMFQNAKRGNINLAVVMLDIDDFGKINKTYGSLGGDEILRKLSNLLSSSFRKTDVITRFDGDSFCLLLVVKQLKDSSVAVSRIQKIIHEHLFELDKDIIKISVSAGICTIIKDSLSDMIFTAERVLKEAKKLGSGIIQMDYSMQRENG